MADQDHAAFLEEILGEADALDPLPPGGARDRAPALGRRRDPGWPGLLRSNVSPEALRSFGGDLKNVANELTAPSAANDTTH